MTIPHRPFRAGAFVRVLALVAVGVSLVAVAACASKPQREVKHVDVPMRNVPEFLRGTIGAETTLRGSEPVLVSGLGVVVGLNGTGGGDLPPNVEATMVRELALNGIGKSGPAGGQLEGVTPQAFLRNKNVAVVIVEASLAPGSPLGTKFDVFVRTLPGSSVTSLEGGRLWTTDLRIGPAAVFGAKKTRKLAQAEGDLYINPFSDTLGGASADTVTDSPLALTRTAGRVLGGGLVTDPLKLEVVLDEPSHSRARTMVSAINTRFPQGPHADGPTARGRAGDSIALRVPDEYANRSVEFIQLVRYMRIDPTFADASAAMYVKTLKEQPAYAEQLSWCLAALGDVARKHLVSMYDYPELAPRMAALEAGARLEDPRTVAPLIDVARNAPSNSMRLGAIELMSRMGGNPNVNIALRELVESPQLDLRVAAYEALSALHDPTLDHVEVAGPDPRRPQFILEQIPSSQPLVYVTQQGEPRVAIFGGKKVSRDGRVSGEELRLSAPVLASMWNDRLMFNDSSGRLRVRFDDARRKSVGEFDAPGDVMDLVEFLARKQSPEELRPGLGLSYSEVVGVLFELTRQDALRATFATEEDKLRAQVFDAATTVLNDRPEDSERAEDIAVQVFRPTAPAAGGGVASGAPGKPGESRRSKIVPLAKPKAK